MEWILIWHSSYICQLIKKIFDILTAQFKNEIARRWKVWIISHFHPLQNKFLEMNINYFFEMIWSVYFFILRKTKAQRTVVSGSVSPSAWRVLRLRMEERLPIWMVAENIFNKKSRTPDKGWYSSLGVGRDANSASP